MSTASLLGVAFGPIFALIIFGVIALGIKLAIALYMPDCWLKRQLLKERIKTRYSDGNKKVLEQAARHTEGWRQR